MSRRRSVKREESKATINIQQCQKEDQSREKSQNQESIFNNGTNNIFSNHIKSSSLKRSPKANFSKKKPRFFKCQFRTLFFLSHFPAKKFACLSPHFKMEFLPEEIEVFSTLQKNVITSRLPPLHLTYSDLQQQFGFQSNQALENFLFRTLLGNHADEANGRIPVVGDVPSLIFIHKAIERADMNNCLKTNQAIRLLEQILADYYFRGYRTAQSMGCPYLAAKILARIESLDIGSSWLNHFCKMHGLTLMNPQSLEHLRNKFCHQNVLLQFHVMLQHVIHQIPELLFNADETSSSFNKKGKVIVPHNRIPYCEEPLQIAHYTMICTFNAAGYKMKPFIILPMAKNFPADLYDFQNQALFASSPSGWVTSKLFLSWAYFFVASLNEYRNKISFSLLQYAPNPYNIPCYLFLDGHRSRLNSEAIELLCRNNIQVIIFPAHTTHVSQPFDVSVAASLKAAIKRLTDNIPTYMQKKIQNFNQAQRSRYVIIQALCDAYDISTTSRNLRSGFAKCGIYPLDFQPLRDNPLIRSSVANDVMGPVRRGVQINGQVITTPDKRLEIAQHFYHDFTLTTIPNPDMQKIFSYITTGDEKILNFIY